MYGLSETKKRFAFIGLQARKKASESCQIMIGNRLAVARHNDVAIFSHSCEVIYCLHCYLQFGLGKNSALCLQGLVRRERKKSDGENCCHI